MTVGLESCPSYLGLQITKTLLQLCQRCFESNVLIKRWPFFLLNERLVTVLIISKKRSKEGVDLKKAFKLLKLRFQVVLVLLIFIVSLTITSIHLSSSLVDVVVQLFHSKLSGKSYSRGGSHCFRDLCEVIEGILEIYLKVIGVLPCRHLV